MASQLDPEFIKRADAFIHLANEQNKTANPGLVSASMMFACARFNAYQSSTGFNSGPEMASKRAETIEFFLNGYREMLIAHLDEYIANWDAYMKNGR
jgi:hypothetical protein